MRSVDSTKISLLAYARIKWISTRLCLYYCHRQCWWW